MKKKKIVAKGDQLDGGNSLIDPKTIKGIKKGKYDVKKNKKDKQP